MCAICGIYNFNKNILVDRNVLEPMARSMKHRGPDDEGFYCDANIGLGHQRLSIIDLSSAARQPMTNEDKRLWLVCNGEIYNYLELRQELVQKGHRFSSHSDSEVILHLYEEHGQDCVSRLNGMFAFAVWDSKNKSLFCARDHFGIKPFYYSSHNNRFVFASEIKAFFKSGLMKPEINPQGLADYFTFQFCLGEKTLFKNIYKLLPGHSLTIRSNGTISLNKYWDLDFTVDTHHTEEYFQHQLLRLLEDSIRLQLRADVPLGAHLSGGLDSSTVACLASSLLGGRIHTFSGGFKESPQYDETQYAAIVAQKIASIHQEVFPRPDDFVNMLPRLVYHMDEPAAGPGLFPQFFVSKLASGNVKVVLGGQGGDEIFGGYSRYLIAYLEECIRGGIDGTQEENKYVVSFESILPNLTQLKAYKPLLKYFWAEGLFEAPEKRYFRLIDRSNGLKNLISNDIFDGSKGYDPFEAYREMFNEGESKSYINKMTHFDLKTLLPALLQVEDRTSMAVSLESRVPLLDYRIAELAASMPPMIKYKGGRSKYIFRKVVRHFIPREINERQDKMGFPVPLNEWYRKKPVRDFVCDTLLGKRSVSRGIFKNEEVKKFLDCERSYGRIIWGLLSLELWMENFVDANSTDKRTGANGVPALAERAE